MNAIAIDMYDEWCEKAQLAVETWLVIGRRLKICKDIRRVIGKMVWDMRGDADYDLEK